MENITEQELSSEEENPQKASSQEKADEAMLAADIIRASLLLNPANQNLPEEDLNKLVQEELKDSME